MHQSRFYFCSSLLSKHKNLIPTMLATLQLSCLRSQHHHRQTPASSPPDQTSSNKLLASRSSKHITGGQTRPAATVITPQTGTHWAAQNPAPASTSNTWTNRAEYRHHDISDWLERYECEIQVTHCWSGFSSDFPHTHTSHLSMHFFVSMLNPHKHIHTHSIAGTQKHTSKHTPVPPMIWQASTVLT